MFLYVMWVPDESGIGGLIVLESHCPRREKSVDFLQV